MEKNGRKLHPAEIRLSELVRTGKAAEVAGKMALKALSSDNNFAMESKPIPLVPVTFRDVGMKDIDELIQTFEDLDKAVRCGDKKKIYELFDRLEPQQRPKLVLVYSRD